MQKRPRGGLAKSTVTNPSYMPPTSTAVSGPAAYAVSVSNINAYSATPTATSSGSVVNSGFAIPTASDANAGTGGTVNHGGFNVPVGI